MFFYPLISQTIISSFPSLYPKYSDWTFLRRTKHFLQSGVPHLQILLKQESHYNRTVIWLLHNLYVCGNRSYSYKSGHRKNPLWNTLVRESKTNLQAGFCDFTTQLGPGKLRHVLPELQKAPLNWARLLSWNSSRNFVRYKKLLVQQTRDDRSGIKQMSPNTRKS